VRDHDDVAVAQVAGQRAGDQRADVVARADLR